MAADVKTQNKEDNSKVDKEKTKKKAKIDKKYESNISGKIRGDCIHEVKYTMMQIA